VYVEKDRGAQVASLSGSSSFPGFGSLHPTQGMHMNRRSSRPPYLPSDLVRAWNLDIEPVRHITAGFHPDLSSDCDCNFFQTAGLVIIPKKRSPPRSRAFNIVSRFPSHFSNTCTYPLIQAWPKVEDEYLDRFTKVQGSEWDEW
jgi:hypothetical protein